ncbi:MAG: hypothetical protein ACOX4M_00570 [Acetivibrionales bacterium]
MVEVYFYIPADKAENAVECGIKLSEWYSREALIDGVVKKCITALLNPRDDYEKYVSSAYRCLKLEVQPKYCYVADSLLYEAGRAYPEVMQLYRDSIVPIEKYVFGSYRLPEALITSTIIGDNISVSGRSLDTPVLYSNSQDLYLGNLLEELKEEHEDLNDTLLYFLFKKLCDEGKAECIEYGEGRLAIFSYKRDGRTYTLRIPDMNGY